VRRGRGAAALEAIHARPTATWTVTRLAREAGLSRSAFAERFRAVVGGPVGYLTRWRLERAYARLVQGDRVSLADLARASGYETDTASW
jgi:AraC-like DNA-binding protein